MDILIDGTRYLLKDFKKEQKFEEYVKDHIKEIFGNNSFFFHKKQLKSLSGLGSIPDGFVIDFEKKKFFVVEFELSTHQVYEHIVNQVGKFIGGMGNTKTRKKVITGINEEIKKDSVLREKIKRIAGGDIHESLYEIIDHPEPNLVVIIDKKTPELNDAFNVIKGKHKALEFKTYARENVGLNVHAHLFDSISRYVYPPAKRKRVSVARRGIKTPDKDYFIPLLETLIEMGGSGRTKEVVDKVGIKMKKSLKPFDLEPLTTGEIRWRNTVEWVRYTLKEKDLLKRDSPRGIWEISDEGRKFVSKYKK